MLACQQYKVQRQCQVASPTIWFGVLLVVWCMAGLANAHAFCLNQQAQVTYYQLIPDSITVSNKILAHISRLLLMPTPSLLLLLLLLLGAVRPQGVPGAIWTG
jgi:hypothetical protein